MLYNFVIHYCPGKSNLANVASRRPDYLAQAHKGNDTTYLLSTLEAKIACVQALRQLHEGNIPICMSTVEVSLG